VYIQCVVTDIYVKEQLIVNHPMHISINNFLQIAIGIFFQKSSFMFRLVEIYEKNLDVLNTLKQFYFLTQTYVGTSSNYVKTIIF